MMQEIPCLPGGGRIQPRDRLVFTGKWTDGRIKCTMCHPPVHPFTPPRLSVRIAPYHSTYTYSGAARLLPNSVSDRKCQVFFHAKNLSKPLRISQNLSKRFED